jgi:integrase
MARRPQGGEAMKLPRYVQGWVDREGRAHHYFRRLGYPRTRLPGLPWSPPFMAAYQSALDAAPAPIGGVRSKPGSLSAAIASYYGSHAFKRGLALTSQQVRKAVLEAFRREHGDKPIALLPKTFIEAVLEDMAPTAARNWLKAIRALVTHCIKVDMLREDPTLGIKLRPIKGDGHHTWSEDEIASFEAAFAIGTRERLALALGLYTGQRRGDVLRMGRQHIRGDVLHVEQSKTGAVLVLPIHPDLHVVLDTVPSPQMTFLQTKRGAPFDPKSFTQWFGQACDKAGLSSACTFHGLRKAACRRLAEAGCTVHEIAAISGHKSLREIERYTKAADQARLAQAAMARTAKAREQSRTKTVKPDPVRVSRPLASLKKKPA